MGDLFHHQCVIRFAFLPLPKYAPRMLLHVINIGLCMKVLVLGKGDGKTSLNFLSFHTKRNYNCYAT